MILVRDVFRLKFGKAREALAVGKEMAEQGMRSGVMSKPRVLTDLVGPYYTLVMETTAKDLATWEMESRKAPYLLSRMEPITRWNVVSYRSDSSRGATATA